MAYPGIQLLPLTLNILIEATRLPGGFRSDPGDEKLLNYEHVSKLA